MQISVDMWGLWSNIKHVYTDGHRRRLPLFECLGVDNSLVLPAPPDEDLLEIVRGASGFGLVDGQEECR